MHIYRQEVIYHVVKNSLNINWSFAITQGKALQDCTFSEQHWNKVRRTRSFNHTLPTAVSINTPFKSEHSSGCASTTLQGESTSNRQPVPTILPLSSPSYTEVLLLCKLMVGKLAKGASYIYTCILTHPPTLPSRFKQWINCVQL